MDTVYETHTAGFVRGALGMATFSRNTGRNDVADKWERCAEMEELWAAKSAGWQVYWS